jgi:hypothetical protein
MERIKSFLTSTVMKRFYWNTFNGVVGVAIAIIGDLSAAYVPFIIAGLNMLTKEINNRYLSD